MTDQYNKLTNNESALRNEVLSVGRHSLIYVVGQALSRIVVKSNSATQNKVGL